MEQKLQKFNEKLLKQREKQIFSFRIEYTIFLFFKDENQNCELRRKVFAYTLSTCKKLFEDYIKKAEGKYS